MYIVWFKGIVWGVLTVISVSVKLSTIGESVIEAPVTISPTLIVPTRLS